MSSPPSPSRDHRSSLCFRSIEDLLADCSLTETYAIIRPWSGEFGSTLARMPSRQQDQVGDVWLMHEVLIPINRGQHRLWKATNQAGDVPDIPITHRCEKRNWDVKTAIKASVETNRSRKSSPPMDIRVWSTRNQVGHRYSTRESSPSGLRIRPVREDMATVPSTGPPPRLAQRARHSLKRRDRFTAAHPASSAGATAAVDARPPETRPSPRNYGS